MSDRLWIPPSTRGFADLGDGISMKAVTGEQAERMISPNDAVFLSAKGFGVEYFEDGEEKYGRRAIPWVEIDFEPLRQQAIDETFEGEHYGVAAGLVADDGTEIPFPGGVQLYVCSADFHVYIGPIEGKAPAGWLDQVTGGAGFIMKFPPLPDDSCPYIATGPLTNFGGKTMVLPPRRRASKVGRNETCPCGSGLKYKRCCGGAS
jgi:hypothetical protein